ncbi:MAG: DUF11 domain-containing protein [Actinobacteria bacterium]|nr:DUF11 domain-containing protein [Actinomycetota bacterium]MCB9414988.1 DUF11 domain-containing protein [Actinomycetota bacterium]TXH43996.1 MAG: DUF11 domain-containing protein [Actinomycetota bacterium]
MFRKLLSGLTSTAVVAGLATAGAVAVAAPAAAVDTFNIPPYKDSQNNPTLASQCGLDFGLVLDASGSIGDTGIANLKTAADAFVDALVDTGSNVAVTSFSTGSPGDGGTNLEPTALTSATLSTVKASYSGLQSNGWTNWRQGLQDMKDYYPPAKSWKPKLMVFITDGNPNTIDSNDGGAFSDGAKGAVDPAIDVANAMKLAGTKMFGIAVGRVSLNPIKAVTNEEAYTGTNFPTAGYVQTPDYQTLKQQLRELAVDLCAPSLTITKLADTPDTQGFQPADGWTFDTTVTIPTAGKWVNPTTDAIAANVASTKSADTANSGAVNFQWKPNSNVATDPVIVKETLKSGYERDPQLVCKAKNILANPPTERDITPTVDGNGNWNLGSIGPREIVTCTAKNTLTQLKLAKTVSGGTAEAKDFTLTATPQGSQTPDYSKPGDNATFEPIKGGVLYTLGETGPAGYSQSGNWSCTGLTVQNGNQVTVPKGTKTTCTVSNTRDTGTLKLTKLFDPKDSGFTGKFTIGYDCVGTTKDGSVQLGAGESATITGVPTGDCTISENSLPTAPANWTFGTPTFDPLNKTVTVVKDATREGKVTNTITRDTGRLKLVKNVSGGSKTANDWTLTATGPNGAPNVSNKGGQGTLTSVWSGVDYTLAEAPNPGTNYTASAWTCKDAQNATVTVNAGKVKVNKGQDVTCTITNTYTAPGINVVKTPDKTEVKAGGSVTYTYTVTNTGISPLSNVTVTDDKCAPVEYKSGDTNTDSKLQPSETWTYTCTAKLTETTTNTALATGYDPEENKVTDTDKATVTVPKPGIDVVKTPDKAEVKAGGSVTYTYEVSNTGDTPLLNVKVTDDKCAPVEYKSGDTDENEILGLKETWTFTCTTTLKETTENTAVATGEDRTGQPVEDTDKAKVIVPKPGLKVVKTASASSVNVGGTVTYTYTVTNTGDIELLNVNVTDDKCSPVNYKSGDTNSDKKLQVDETWIFECSQVLTVATTNTAVVSGEDRTGQPVSAQDTITVPVVSPVVVKKICPIDVTLHKPQPTKVGNKILTDKIKTKKSSCVLLKPVVLCRPIASSAAGETAFCDTKVTKKGRITVKTKGYEAVRVSVIVRTKPKPGFSDRWKPDTWRKSWKLK